MRGSFALRAQDDGERQRQIQGSFDSLRSLRMTVGKASRRAERR
jgi:hypothetical protein